MGFCILLCGKKKKKKRNETKKDSAAIMADLDALLSLCLRMIERSQHLPDKKNNECLPTLECYVLPIMCINSKHITTSPHSRQALSYANPMK